MKLRKGKIFALLILIVLGCMLSLVTITIGAHWAIEQLF